MKKAFLIVALLLVLTLSSCSWLSNNSDDDTRTWSKDRTSDTDTDILSENDVRLIDVQVDGRTWIEVESPCPMVVQAGDGSCNVKVTK